MITFREFQFRAMVALDAAGPADTVRALVDRRRTQCVLQPRDGKWFPAAIGFCWVPSHGSPVDAVVRVHLLAEEAEAFFAAGQPFTLWADAMVEDQTIRGGGLLGDGVITGLEPEVWPTTDEHEDSRATARRTPRYQPMVPQPSSSVGASPRLVDLRHPDSVEGSNARLRPSAGMN